MRKLHFVIFFDLKNCEFKGIVKLYLADSMQFLFAKSYSHMQFLLKRVKVAVL